MANYYISSGQSSRGLGVKDGYMYIYSGGTATSTTVNSGGYLVVKPGGEVITATINSGGGMQVSSRGEAASTTVNKGAYQSVYCGGTVISTTVNSGGKLDVASGGTAINTTVNPCGMYTVSGTATGITVNSGGSVYVSSGGTASYTTVYGGCMHVSSGGKATNTVVSEGGDLGVYSGTVNSTTVYSGGIFVINGGTATVTQVNFGGGLNVASGGTATEITVTQGGRLGLTVASNTYIQGTFDGSAFLMKNAYLSGYTVNSGGSLCVASGGTATNTIVDSGGSLAVSKGKVTGSLFIVNGAKVSMDTGSILDFDISRRTTYSPVLVNNLSLVSGSPNCTITVSSDQAAGVYSLAGGAAGFDGKFTIGTDGANFGTITVNGNVLTHGSMTYSLSVAGSTLQLTVAGKSTPTPPPTPEQTIEDIGAISIGKTVKGSLGYNGNIQDNAVFTVGTAGTYRVEGNFGTLNASVTISSGNKAVATGTVKNGQLTFNKGNPVMLAPGQYSLALKSSDKGKTSSDYTFAVKSVTLFNKGDQDSQAAPHQIGTVTSAKKLVSDGWVGFGDEFDYYTFTLNKPANLVLDYTSTDAAKFTLFNAATGKSVMTSTLKAGTALSTKPKLLEKGQYYLEVQSTNAKKGGDARYTVAVDDRSLIYTKGDTTDDTPDKAKNLGAVTTKPKMLVNNEWVGVGDEFDYRKFTLNSGAKLNFTVNASDAVKFTVYQLDAKGKLKSLGNVSVKAGTPANTKDIFVEAGTYYLSVQSTKAKKDGNANYSVELNGNSRIFPAGDHNNDNWQAAADKPAKLAGEVITGWVGFGDASDFIKFQLNKSGQIQLNLNDAETKNAFASKQIKLTCLDENGKSVALGILDGDTLVSKKPVDAGKYYLGVTCANVKKYDTSYSITTGILAS